MPTDPDSSATPSSPDSMPDAPEFEPVLAPGGPVARPDEQSDRDLIPLEQVRRVADRRREIQAQEAAQRARDPHAGRSVHGGIATFDGTCAYCEQPFEYEAPAAIVGDRALRITGPRRWCHAEECVAKHDADVKAERDAEYERMQAEELEARRRAYVEQVPAIYHRKARIAPASTAHLIEELAEWNAEQSLYLHGPSSSGKSHQVACLMHRVAGRHTFEWHSTRRLLADAQAAIGSKGKRETPAIIGNPLACRVLVLNDVFAERATEWAATTIGNLVDARYEAGLPIVFTSNVAPSEIPGTVDTSRRDAAAVALELERIRDRIIEMTSPPWGLRHRLEGQNWRHAMADGGESS